MPEFIVNSSGTIRVTWSDLDEFTQGYIEALFFTSECPQVDSDEFATPECQKAISEGTQDGVLPCDVGFADFSLEAIGKIAIDCGRFQRGNSKLLDSAYAGGDYSPEQAGRDFWFTRNGHGVGFWSRDLGEIGDKLTTAAYKWPELNPFFDIETGKVGVE